MDSRVKVIVDAVSKSIKNEISEDYADAGILTYKEYLKVAGLNYKGAKEECAYIIEEYCAGHSDMSLFVTDDLEIISENGDVVPYQKWIKAVAKGIFGASPIIGADE